MQKSVHCTIWVNLSLINIKPCPAGSIIDLEKFNHETFKTPVHKFSFLKCKTYKNIFKNVEDS